MDKNRKIRIAALAAAVAGLLAYLYMFAPDVQMLKSTASRRIIEASLVTVRGSEKGKLSFEIRAEKASSDKDQSVIEIENVSFGNVYGDDGRIVMKDLKARNVTVQQYSNIIEAQGKDKEPLSAMLDIGRASGKKPSGKRQMSLLTAESLRYNTSTKKGSVNRGSLQGKKFRISGDNIGLDAAEGKAVFYPYAAARSQTQTIKAMTLESHFEREVLKGLNDTELNLQKHGTTAKADYLEFSTETLDGSMEGNVRLIQKGKFSTADRMDYDNSAGTAVLMGSVKTLIEKGSAMLDESTVQKIRNAETKKVLKDGMLLICQKLSVSVDSGNASAEGKVELLQKNNRARSDRAYFDKKKETVVMTGNVHIEKEGQWLKTQKITASLGKEEFEATGGVETLIRIKRQR